MTTCEQVRERASEHVLGTLSADEDRSTRRHLRGCAACRSEMNDLSEGLGLFARAVHDGVPPPELQDQVRAALQEEWRDLDGQRGASRRPTWMLAAAAVVAALLVASVSVAAVQTQRAQVAANGAQSYDRLLETLGGKDFRLGKLTSTGHQPLDGSIVVYDSHVDQSWVLVFVRTSGVSGEAIATLRTADGRTLDTWPISIDRDGDGYGWLVTSVDLGPFDRVALTRDDGSALATGRIEPA